jgi:hypothetical protein
VTQIFPSDEAARAKKATHAFIIGVGDYPDAKLDGGTDPDLRGVRDLPSAADSAKLMCDWLIANQDKLAAPLGSIEVLISDVAGGGSRYAPLDPALRGPIDRADGTTIPLAGQAWLDRLAGDPGGTAFFYACGHGANHGTLPVLFHSDLNRRRGADAYAHLNIGRMAQAFRQMTDLAAGFFFVDACGEFVKTFPPDVRDDGFVSPGLPKDTDRDKVWLLSAASAALLAYPGLDADDRYRLFEEKVDGNGSIRAVTEDGTPVKIGRFTQALLKGLNGASARWNGEGWSVDNIGLWSDLKPLHRIYFPSWKDKPFEPSEFLTPNDRVPIIRHATPRFPVLVSTDPVQRTAEFDLKIGLAGDGTEPWIDSRQERIADAWLTHVNGDRSRPVYALALDGAGACHSSFFKAEQPQFDQRVPIT